MIASLTLTQLLHPLSGNGYQFWSGIGSDFGQLTLLTGMVAISVGWWRHHNCHVKGCWRLNWHGAPTEDGHPRCRKHHPHDPPAS